MAALTFFFYDLETSGLDPRRHRIMQFAGIRTDLELKTIGQPVNFLIKLSPEVLPDPQAVLITGITPQATLESGLSEREAMDHIMSEAFTPDTIAVGFNNIRFDDEFTRYTAYRNFWDPYEWAYADGRSRWDMLDVVRLVRALRPEGITWPTDENDAPINTLETLARANNLSHAKAHDALSDVEALIDITRLIRQRQPKIFQYLLDGRSKEAVTKVVSPARPEPFIYSSGRYGKKHNFTTIAVAVGAGDNNKLIVYDLRYDPTPYLKLSVQQLRDLRFTKREDRDKPGYLPLPAKELTTNKCPAVAPLATLRDEDAERLDIDREEIAHNLQLLRASDLGTKLVDVFTAKTTYPKTADVDASLYDGFVGQSDKSELFKVRRASIEELAIIQPNFADARLPELFMRYKGRNAPQTLSEHEKAQWQAYVSKRRQTDLALFEKALASYRGRTKGNEGELLDALAAWAE
jgi:exodeoxyribonuclease-1